MELQETKTCPRCGVVFECKPGNIGECLCFGIQLSSEQKSFLEQHFNSCLCRNCLTQLQNDFASFKEKIIRN